MDKLLKLNNSQLYFVIMLALVLIIFAIVVSIIYTSLGASTIQVVSVTFVEFTGIFLFIRWLIS